MNYQLDKRLGQRLILMLLKQIGTSPLFIWGGLLTLLLSVASIATQELTSPGPIEPAEIAASPVQSSEPATTLAPQGDRVQSRTPINIPTVVESPSVVPSRRAAVEISPQTSEALPIWLFGAIAMGCAGGSWLISQQVNPRPMGDRMVMGDRPSLGQVSRPRRPTRPRTSLAQREATESGRVMSRRERSRPASARVPQQTSRSRTAPEVSRATMRGRPYMTGQLRPRKPSPNVIYRGDRALGGERKGSKKNLAEMMDIRKLNSVASVVRNI